MTTNALAGQRALHARRALFTPLTRLLNPTIRRIAGRSGVPLVGLVSHQGRRSGRTYATPVGIGSTGDAFLIPLTFGSTSDWCRNVLAAGGCTLTWNGHEYAADQAQIVDDVSARVDLKAAFGPLPRLLFRAMGIHEFLRLSAPDARQASDRRPRQSTRSLHAGEVLRGAALYLIAHWLNPLMIALANRRPQARVAILEHRASTLLTVEKGRTIGEPCARLRAWSWC